MWRLLSSHKKQTEQNTTSSMTLLMNKIRNMLNKKSQPYPAPAVMGDELIMKPKAHGTSEVPVQENLRWNCDWETADRISNFNRHFAEHSGYFRKATFFKEANGFAKMTFYDSNTGKPLFVVGGGPEKRSMKEFLKESAAHGWPSFRDNEVNWEHVRVLKNGECVSTAGTHLGHNLPDKLGSRYCINLVSIAGRPVSE